MQRVFISYSHDDVAYMTLVANLVRSVLPDSPVFVDNQSLRGGDRWQKTIGDAIADCDVFVVLWSRRASDSEWVHREIDLALERKRSRAGLRILPVVVDGSALADELAEFQSISLELVTSPATRRAMIQVVALATIALGLAFVAYARNSHRILGCLLLAALWTGTTAFVGLRMSKAPWRERASGASIRLLFGTFEVPPSVAAAMLWASIAVSAMSATLSWLLRS